MKIIKGKMIGLTHNAEIVVFDNRSEFDNKEKFNELREKHGLYHLYASTKDVIDACEQGSNMPEVVDFIEDVLDGIGSAVVYERWKELKEKIEGITNEKEQIYSDKSAPIQ